ncbi:hypothetical protein [Marivirga harenae]|uniref:hypothetical protein n=1 Tax=Marivirga harenae TaxID=2010992 RepID=UPI0026DF5382|nr:hypothetical protein [Marivirga harenae]WKV12567.1 hypothetical protein Q3Y49_01800 [Marivirga harenae]|tara:strand:+ start:1918 stop:2721 length:804 start_codon:yes stop_codon:yes gene_type:complete
MKKLILIHVIFLNLFNSFSQVQVVEEKVYSENLREVSSPIKASIIEDFDNLNMFEYAHTLPELLSVLNKSEKYKRKWIAYLNSLSQKISDTTESRYYASKDSLVIILQSTFFYNTLQQIKTENIENKDALLFLKNNLKKLSTCSSISNSDILDKIQISDQRGYTNFWYFFQVFGCDFVQNIVLEDEELKRYFLMNIEEFEIISTYKIPYELQKLKWQNIQERLNGNRDCKGIVNQMNSREIGIFDDDKDFYSTGLKEGINKLSEREF